VGLIEFGRVIVESEDFNEKVRKTSDNSAKQSLFLFVGPI